MPETHLLGPYFHLNLYYMHGRDADYLRTTLKDLIRRVCRANGAGAIFSTFDFSGTSRRGRLSKEVRFMTE